MVAEPYTITISDDEMEAWICFHVDTPLSYERLCADMSTAGVVFSVDWFLLEDLAEARTPGEHYRIAQGQQAEEGLEYFFALTPDRTPKRLPDGRVDFYNLNTIQNVVQHQVLVAKIPPTEARPGRTVTGRELLPEGRDESLPAPGRNVALTEDGEALCALINGYPVLSGQVLSVEPTYTLEGDVNFSVGNITCVGNLVIIGDVKGGFNIKCARGVTIHGVVEDACLEMGGTLYLLGNVFGNHKGSIRCGASVRGTLVDAARVEARKDIILTRGARHSQLQAGGSILIQGSDGYVVGGRIQAGERILVHDVGSVSEVPTWLEIMPGVYDTGINTRFLDQLAALLEDDGILLTERMPMQVGASTNGTVQEVRAMIQACQAAVRCLSDYLQRRWQLLSVVPMQIGTIVVTGTVYPGVTVGINGAVFQVRAPVRNSLFYHDDGAVHVRGLSG